VTRGYGRLTFVNAYRTSVDPLEALGDDTRRSIVEALRGGERTVGDLAASLPVSRPAVSQHLAVLRAAGLVLDRPQGTRRWYRLDPIGLVRLQDRLEALWGLEAEAAPAAAMVSAAAPSTPALPDREVAIREDRATPPTAEREAPAAKPATDTPGKGERKKRKKKGGRK
jgi:DNA-binding transcriptional ArsR family regulator